jgi:hypothetical protein
MGADLVVRGAKNAVKFFVDTQVDAEQIEILSIPHMLSNDDIDFIQSEDDILAEQYAAKFKTSVEHMIAIRDQPKVK